MTVKIPQQSIEHPDETSSNVLRRRASEAEPRSLRTYTPSMAVLRRSAGSYHWTPDGRRLMDFTSGVLVANLGHNSVSWTRRLLNYLGWPVDAQRFPDEPYFAAAPLTSYNAVTELEIAASERLVATLRRATGGGRLEQVMWSASGSEAVQKALWAALKRDPQRQLILATRHGFHGKKGLAGAVTGSEHDADRDPRVRFVSFPRHECRDVSARREPLDPAPYQAELQRLIEEVGGQACCLITEPYLGGGGSYHPQPEYLQLLQAFCRDHDLLLILDEVQSNFGRTGPMFAYTHYGIEPDVVCLGKGLGNGVAVSAAVGSAEVMGVLDYGEGSDTWSGNPLSSSAVLATLDEFEQGDVLEQARSLSVVLEQGLEALKETGLALHVRGEGCVWGVECQALGGLSSQQVAAAIVRACYRGDAQGRALHLLGPLAGNVLRVSPPLTTHPDEAGEYLAAMKGIMERLSTEGGEVVA